MANTVADDMIDFVFVFSVDRFRWWTALWSL